jgi:hypothetical protein
MDTELVGRWSLEERLGETLTRAAPKLGPEAGAQLKALIEPSALAMMAGVLVAWVASHSFGLGEIIDVVMLAMGVVSVGWAIFGGVDDLYEFAVGVYRAQTTRDLDRAAEFLAKAVAVLGVQAVLAVLFRGAKAPRVGKGGRFNMGQGPSTGGMRYKPTITQDPLMAAGDGVTSWWGDIEVSSLGSSTDRALVLLHEKVHQFLAPKFYVLRDYRVSNRATSYVRSSLYRYIEEAVCETVARVGVNGFREFFTGMKFPVKSGYMYLRRGGGFDQRFRGHGLVPEGKAVVWVGVASGVALELLFVPGVPAMRHGQPQAAGMSAHDTARAR